MDSATIPKVLCIWVLCFAAPVASAAHQIVGLDNLDLGLWTPASGNVSAADDFCVASRLGNSQNAGRYSVRVTPLGSAVFELRGVASPTVAIPLTLTFQDLTDGGLTALVPATYSPREQAGVRNCTGTNNARLIAAALGTNIVAATPGEYLGQFEFTARSVPPKTTLSRNFSVRFRVSEMIRISGLDSIDLGAFDGVADRRGEDDFCVYSNGLTGRYTVTSYGQGAGSAFQLSSGVGTLPFLLEYDDGNGLSPVAPAVPVQKQNANGTSIDCIGGNNAQIRATVNASDLRTAPSGTYVGEVTLIVAPI